MDEVEEKRMEMFLITDYEVIKKLLKYTSYPSKTYLYQMPNKAESYVDGSVESASNLMNTLLEYQRSEDWRVDVCNHVSDWVYNEEKIGITLQSTKTEKQVNVIFEGIKEVIVVPDLHCITVVPTEKIGGDIQPNTVMRFAGFVQHRYLKCVLVGEDDPENEGKRKLNMLFEPIENS